jgi:thiosulfate/3-mercaptopyruvate sulfurtransferase
LKALVRPEELKNHLSAFVVLDARFRLNDPRAGGRLFTQAHIPGAQYISLETELSGAKTGKNGRHPLPDRAALAATFSKFGIGADTPVITYDDADHGGAARAWFLLRWMGHANSFVLDGGLKVWTDLGYPTEVGSARARPPQAFPERAPLVEVVTKEELAGAPLVDARAPERYRGEVEPLDAQAGHIPGAQNLFYQKVLGADGRFLKGEELKAVLPREKTIFYCGSGVTASVLALAATVADQPSALYAGSWSEYSADPRAPVAKGEEP